MYVCRKILSCPRGNSALAAVEVFRTLSPRKHGLRGGSGVGAVGQWQGQQTFVEQTQPFLEQLVAALGVT